MRTYLKQILVKLNITSSAEELDVYEQAVIIYFDYNLNSSDPFYGLVHELRNCIENNNLGDYDGHEMAMDNSDGSIYMYSADAIGLFNGVKAILRKTDFLKGANVVIRHDDTNEEHIIL